MQIHPLGYPVPTHSFIITASKIGRSESFILVEIYLNVKETGILSSRAPHCMWKCTDVISYGSQAEVLTFTSHYKLLSNILFSSLPAQAVNTSKRQKAWEVQQQGEAILASSKDPLFMQTSSSSGIISMQRLRSDGQELKQQWYTL